MPAGTGVVSEGGATTTPSARRRHHPTKGPLAHRRCIPTVPILPIQQIRPSFLTDSASYAPEVKKGGVVVCWRGEQEA